MPYLEYVASSAPFSSRPVLVRAQRKEEVVGAMSGISNIQYGNVVLAMQ
jgi:hypothetical protein